VLTKLSQQRFASTNFKKGRKLDDFKMKGQLREHVKIERS